MATRKRGRAGTPPTDQPDVELANLAGFGLAAPPSPTEERRDRELEEILAELGSDARIKVYQIVDGKSSYAGDLSAEGFTLDVLLDNYGGGDKSLSIMQGKSRIETVRVSLDPSIPPRNPRAAKVVAPGSNGAPDMGTLFAAIAASQVQSAQAMTNMMGGIVTALTAVMTATKPTSDPMDTALRMAEVMNKKGGDGGTVTEALKMFREGMELGERFGGGKDEDPVLGVVSKGLDTLGAVVSGIMSERKDKADAAARAQQHELPLPSSGYTADNLPATNQPDTPVMPTHTRPWTKAAAPHMSKLLSFAAVMSPESAADTISRAMSDEEFDDLINDLNDTDGGGFGVRLGEYFPEVRTVDPEWIGHVLRAVLDSVDDTDEPATGGANNGS